jgi:hypothetical protein
MSRSRRLCLFGALLSTLACRGMPGRLPRGADLGPYADVDEPEYYAAQSLYAYMNGGAEIYNEYGFSQLWVRRYARDSRELVVELFEMRDARAAFGIYSYARRAGAEVDVADGCRGSLAGTEAKLAKGAYFLVCRAQDPMASADRLVRDICARIAKRLSGECGAGDAFLILDGNARIAGSEIHLAGPIGLNVRPWLSSIGREGFGQGWLVKYELPAGKAEAFLAEYKSADLAEKSHERLLADAQSIGRWIGRKGRYLVLVQGGDPPREQIEDLGARLISAASKAGAHAT